MHAPDSSTKASSPCQELPSTLKARIELSEKEMCLNLTEGEPSTGPRRDVLSSASTAAPTSESVETSSSSPNTSAFQRTQSQQLSQNFNNQPCVKYSSSFSVSEFFGLMRQHIYAGETYPVDKSAPSNGVCRENDLHSGTTATEMLRNPVSSSVNSVGFGADPAFIVSGREVLPSNTAMCSPYFKTFLGNLGLIQETKGDIRPFSSSGIADRETWNPHMDLSASRTPHLICIPPSEAAPSSSSPAPVCDTTTSGTPRFSCNVCHKGFRQQASLLVHMRVHSGVRPYQCNTCSKTFNQAANLIAHQRTHTGERPYECMECGKRFTQQGNLMTHNRTHSKEKPYECDVCHKSFSQAGNLKTHQRIHLGLRPYQCAHCSMDFTQLSGLQSHQRSKHSISEPSKRRRTDRQTASSMTSADSTSTPAVSETESSAVTLSYPCQSLGPGDHRQHNEEDVQQHLTHI